MRASWPLHHRPTRAVERPDPARAVFDVLDAHTEVAARRRIVVERAQYDIHALAAPIGSRVRGIVIGRLVRAAERTV